MSAFLCSDLHTAAVALYASRIIKSDKPASKLVSEFRALNNAALAYRYEDQPVRIRSIKSALADADAYIKTIPDYLLASHMNAMTECLQYQCSEGNVLEEHKFARFFNGCVDSINKVANGVSRKGVWAIG